MKNRILLAVTVGVSLVLAAVIYAHRSVNTRMAQSLSMLDDLPKPERDRFYSNALEFYQHNSKAAHNERKRLRSLYYQIQNAQDNKRLMNTMELYVDWVDRFSDQASMREIHSKSVDARVEAVHRAVQDEQRQIGNTESLVVTERLKDAIRESLTPQLRTVDLKLLSDAFDDWLTQKYDEAKDGLTEKHRNDLQRLETFYRVLFQHAGLDVSSEGRLEIPEKLIMLQLIQNLSSRQVTGGGTGGGAGFPPRFGGGPRMGGGNIFFRPGGVPFGGGVLRDDLFERLDRVLFDQIDESARQTPESMPRPTRNETLQRLLALAVLERYPSLDSGRFFQAISRTDPQDWIEILGVCLSLMSSQRREEFLRQDSRSTLNRLQGELWLDAMAYFGMFRPPRPQDNRSPGPPSGPPSGMGQPPPPRGGLPRNDTAQSADNPS